MPHPPRPTPDDVPAAERAALRRGRLRPWLPFLLAAVLCLALLGWALVALPGLPERVPTHWGVDGRPDAWEDASFGTVAAGPLIGLGVTGFLALVSAMVTALVPTDPGLSPWRRVRQAGVHRGVQESLGWSCVLIVLVLAPTIGALLQLALSRTREYDADLGGALLTGDPMALAGALRKLERNGRGLWESLLMPGRRDPNPSLLRTHPPTEERIRRLAALSGQLDDGRIASAAGGHGPGSGRFREVRSRPRHRLTGLWY